MFNFSLPDTFDQFVQEKLSFVGQVIFHIPADGDQFPIRVVDYFQHFPVVSGQGFMQRIAYFEFHGKLSEN